MNTLFKGTLLAATAAVGMSLGTAPAVAATDILIGGGSVTGVYYQVALQTCALMNKHSGGKYNCVGRPALGSSFNINAVDRGLLDFGVAQSDVQSQAWNGEGEWDGKKKENIRAVFSMHPELLYVMTTKDSGIKSIADMKGKTISIGNPGSGQRGMALTVLPMYGIDPDKDIQAEGLQQNEASRALIDGKVDAFFYSVGHGSAAIEEPANSVDAAFVPVNSDAIKEMVASKPYYVMSTIPAGMYKGVDTDTETYGVKATVVASAAASDEMVYDFVKTIFSNLDELKKTHAAFKTLNPKEMLMGLSAPLHPGAEKYYKEMGWM
ncbi:TAXI family TRAP transporter solute-binding subunit [Magnetospira thiophila]